MPWVPDESPRWPPEIDADDMPSPFLAWARDRDHTNSHAGCAPQTAWRSEKPSAYLIKDVSGGLCLLFDLKQAEACIGKPMTERVIPLFEGRPIYVAAQPSAEGGEHG